QHDGAQRRRGAAPGRGRAARRRARRRSARMSATPETLDEVTPELVRRIEEALDGGRNDEVKSILAELNAAGQAAVLEQIAEPHRDALIALTKRDLDPEVLAELDEDVRDDVLEQLDSKEIAAAARELETDDAA